MIVSVAALDFAVVPRRSRADRFVRDAVFLAKQIQRVYALRLRGMAKLAAVVGLNVDKRQSQNGEVDRRAGSENRRTGSENGGSGNLQITGRGAGSRARTQTGTGNARRDV